MGRKIETIKIRADFLRLANTGRRSAGPSLVVQAASRPAGFPGGARIRVGFTASRKVGNAVVRNRAKRRMRVAAAIVLATHGLPGTDYVLIARASTANGPFLDLVGDLRAALGRLDRAAGRRPAPLTPEM